MFNSLEGNRNSVDERALGMRLSKLINTSRCLVINTAGLVEDFKSGRVQGATLYLMEYEKHPLKSRYPLISAATKIPVRTGEYDFDTPYC